MESSARSQVLSTPRALDLRSGYRGLKENVVLGAPSRFR